MSAPLFLQDSYLRQAVGTVTHMTDEGGIVLDNPLFYATSGGQPGDIGQITWDNGALNIAATIKGPEGQSVLIPAEPRALPQVGQQVQQVLDWERRYTHMRMHTALHLLSVVIPLPVTGGSIGVARSRLDFDMPEAPDNKDQLQARLNDLVAADLPVSETWITDAELDANPGLVKTMSVAPPRGAGRIRLVRIGDDGAQVDLQPCGGTHVARTGEIGPITLGKVEKKGRQNRRVYLSLDAI